MKSIRSAPFATLLLITFFFSCSSAEDQNDSGISSDGIDEVRESADNQDASHPQDEHQVVEESLQAADDAGGNIEAVDGMAEESPEAGEDGSNQPEDGASVLDDSSSPPDQPNDSGPTDGSVQETGEGVSMDGEEVSTDGEFNDGEVLSEQEAGSEEVACSFQKIGMDLRLTTAAEDDVNPAIVWTGTEYGLAWHRTWYDNREQDEIYFIRLNLQGNPIGSEVRVTNADGLSRHVRMVWTGSEYGMVWYDDRGGNSDIYFVRLDSSGQKIGADVQITQDETAAIMPDLVWTGTEYGISWRNFRNGYNASDVYFVRLDSKGNKIGSEIQVNDGGSDGTYHVWRSSVVWTGVEYGVAWDHSWDDYQGSGIPNASIFFGRIDNQGAKIGTDLMVSDVYEITTSYEPCMAWNGTEFAVSWHLEDLFAGIPDKEIMLARIDSQGIEIGTDSRITNTPGDSSNPSLVWNGLEYGVAWNDSREGDSGEIYFVRLDSDGSKLGDEIRITDSADGAQSIWPALAGSNSEYGVVWSDGRDGQYEIYFTRFGCP